MSSRKRITETFRRDQKFNHQLLTPEERIKLLQPHLPEPPPSSAGKGKTKQPRSTFGIRRFLKTQLQILLFTIIHTIFSLYIRLRQAYHVVTNQIYSILFYHHRTPELIQRDIKHLRRLPNHISVVLTRDELAKGGAELEKLVDEAAEVAAWCACAGIWRLTIYEKTGTLRAYLPQTHAAMADKLQQYFGRKFPALTLAAPHTPPVESADRPRGPRFDNGTPKRMSVMLISAADGRDSIVDLTKTLAEMAQRGKISTEDITTDLVDAELTENVVGEPDLVVLFGPYVQLDGYPPWQIRLAEIFHVQDNQGVAYRVFYRALCNYARAEFRLGR